MPNHVQEHVVQPFLEFKRLIVRVFGFEPAGGALDEPPSGHLRYPI